jgi:hypothetical protein
LGNIKVGKKDIHFIGFLANVDDSILKLNLGQPFTIEKKSQDKVTAFQRHICSHWGTSAELQVLAVEEHGNDFVRDQSFHFYCVTARNVESFDSTSQGGVVICPDALERIFYSLRDKVRLLRLFKEGNILMRFSLFYHLEGSEPKIIWSILEGPLFDMTLFKLEDDEVVQSQDFLNKVKMPFEKKLQLAFESFELSYESHSAALNFLSLMIAMEVMFNRGKDELRYTISRNAAVLLGKDKDDSERIFKEVRGLYDKRSKLVHEGSANEVNPRDLLILRHYVREAIKEMQSIGRDPKEIRDILNICGFGQRPWRDGC